MVDIKQRWRILTLILISLVISGCQSQQDEGTPTPFGTWVPVGDNRPVVVELADIIDFPDSYEGAYIQLSGQYKRLPLLVCGSDAHPSPATWQLSSPEGTIVASGRESDLRRLIPDGLWMTVTGRMTYFEGAVGCGKRARTEQTWYLDVDQIVSPNPIARVTLTPGGVPISNENTPDGSETIAFPTVPPLPELAFPTATPIATPIPISTPAPVLTPTPLPLTPAITATTDDKGENDLTATPTRIDSGDGTATATIEATSTSRGTAVAVTSTPPAGTLPTTPSTGSSTATSTPPSGNTTTVDKGNLTYEEILSGELSSNEQHKWLLNTAASDTLTAYVVGDSQMDMMITVLNSLTGDVIIKQNETGVGEAETLVLDITSGQYDVILSAVGGNNGRYSALYTLSDPSIDMTMLGLIGYGDTESGTLATVNDHYWVFEGEQGDKININVIPAGSTDLMIELLDYTNFVDDNGVGGAEEIQFTLPSDGLYILLVAEVDFETAVYTITITKTN